jgi:hypothetical protein
MAMTFVFPEDSFNTTGDFLNHGGHANLMEALNEDDGMFLSRHVSTTHYNLKQWDVPTFCQLSIRLPVMLTYLVKMRFHLIGSIGRIHHYSRCLSRLKN